MSASSFPVVDAADFDPITSAESARLDAAAVESGIPVELLMEIAGWQCARAISDLGDAGAPVALLIGTGNNGGDGLVAARVLATFGTPCRCGILGGTGRLKELPRIQYGRAKDAGVDAVPLERADDITEFLRVVPVLVDALVGTGASLPLRGLVADAVTSANAASAFRIALDSPSGLPGGRGNVDGPVFHADATIMICAPKEGVLAHRGIAGTLLLADLPMPRDAWASIGKTSPSGILKGGIARIA